MDIIEPKKTYEFKEDVYSQSSEFNAGIAKLMRIDKIKIGAIQARQTGELDQWMKWLEAYESELYYKCNKEVRNELKDMRNNLIKEQNTWHNQLKTTATMGRNTIKDGFYNALDAYDKRLCDLEFEFGLGMPDKKSSAGAMSK